MQVVVGATGGTGSALVSELLGRGYQVRAVSRRGDCAIAGAEPVAADATDVDRMREVCAGASAVYNCVNPPLPRWRELFPEVIRSLVAAASAADAVLAFADDTWMYGRVVGPMREDTPVRPVTELGVFRAWLAEMLMSAHHRGDVRVVIARGGELYGPAVESVLAQNLFGRAVAGRTPVWFGNPDLPITPTYIGDFARALATLGATGDSWGQVWHVPQSAPTTGREFVRELCRQVDRSDRLWAMSQKMFTPVKLISPVARIGASLLYQFEQPFVIDAGKYAGTFGEPATTYAEGIANTLAWYQQNRSLVRASALPR